jgi:hypothetical protein
MKALIFTLIVIIFISCGNSTPTLSTDGTVRLDLNGEVIKRTPGVHNDFIRLLGNGDSLFISYEVIPCDNEQGYAYNTIYYTSGDRTKELKWSVSNGKSSTDVSNVQN